MRDHDLTQARARFAYGVVARWQGDAAKNAKTRVQGLPIQVRTQGLLITLAMLNGESKTETINLAAAVADWLLRDAPVRALDETAAQEVSAHGLLVALAEADRAAYTAAQREAILLLDQIKVFAKALHGGEG